MRFLKTIILAGLIVVVLVSIMLVYFLLTFDSNYYKNDIAQLVSEQTGRELNIEGDLSLSVFPDISIKMGKATLQNAEGYTPEHIAKIDAANIAVELLPMLEKDLKVREVSLDGLVLSLHKQADGSSNWDSFLGESKQTGTTEQAITPQSLIAGFSVAGISLTNANISWQDDTNGQYITLSPLNLQTGTLKPNQPLPIQLQTLYKQHNMQADINADATVTLNEDKSFQLGNLKLSTLLKGEAVQNGQVQANLQGNVSGNQSALDIPDLQLQTSITGGLVPAGALQANLSGNTRIDLDAQKVNVQNMHLQTDISGDMVQNGQLKTDLKGDAAFNLLTQLLEIANTQLTTDYQGGALKSGSLQSKITAKTRLNLDSADLYLENLSIHSSLNTLDIPGGVLQQQASGQLKLNWQNKTGSADLNPLQLNLADLQVSGSTQIRQLMTEPTLSGYFKTSDFNLRQLLQSLKIEAPQTANPALLGSSKANFKLEASPDAVKLSELRMKLDQLALSGEVGMSHLSAKTPTIKADLSIPKWNVDEYVPAGNEQANPGSALLPLAAMRDLNGDIRFRVGSMVYSKIRLQNVDVNVHANDGIVTAKPIVADLYQGKYQGHMTLNTASQTPNISMRHELSGLRSEDLLFDLYNDKIISGTGFMTTELTTAGNSVNAIKHNLNGFLNIEFRDGTIRDSNFAKNTEIAIKAFEEKRTDGEGKETVKFTKLAGDWTAKSGVFTTDNMQMLAPRFLLKGTGDIQLPQETLDFKLRLSENKDDAEIFLPFHIFGPFKQLSYQLELDVLLKALAKKRLDEEKEKLQEKLKAEKKKAEERLRQEAEDRLKQEQEKLQKRLNDEKKKLEEKLKEKVGDEVTDQIKKQLGDQGKELEDQLKDKLKDQFKNFF
jgi:uncharacterized protein involved in outer membrane biogenesis